MKRETQLSLDEKHYLASSVEEKTYAMWESAQVFTHDVNSAKPPYCIVIPPPNVTGRLHMGHALNNSVQDALIRFKRMDGFDVLWVPGTDHAGISTQSVVKKHLDAEGVDYLSLGREAVIERIWQWKEKYGDQILRQLRRLGCSCDWEMTRFTMDEGLSHAVRAAFVHLYNRGLIYRGKYIVNWCPVDRTALSDDEVVTQDGGEPGHLWHLRYPLADGSGHVVIATTRPETMLGDTAVAVNPKDERYQHLIGQMIRLPLVGREIPIIADEYVDRSFGSGCLKVTPAHDPNDFQIGLRHGLPAINVMNEDATMGDEAPEQFHGMDRFICRAEVIQQLQAAGLVERIEERMTPVGRAQRSRAVIEYRLSDQWFVRMAPLAEAALAASDRQDVQLYPERWDRVYRSWLENIRDWCISRQIWWGHRIPAWYHRDTGEIRVALEEPEEVRAEPGMWRQDEDVLDTWFSSALWPFSTLGWPEQTADLARYYPTSVLSTAKDIIYFWVARMVMCGLELIEDVPFRQVYFHPVICDARGETMSKSKGNGIDPLHVIDGASTLDLEGPIHEARPENMNELLSELRAHHPEGFQAVGADALRVTLLSLSSHAQQVQISLSKFEETGKRFTDKLWNAARFVLSNLKPQRAIPVDPQHYTMEDRWILGQLDSTTQTVRACFESFEFSRGLSELLRFFWDDFCDWYVELTKERLRSGGESDSALVQSVLVEALSTTLRLLHPFAPHITEELWGHLYNTCVGSSLEQYLDQQPVAPLCAQASYPHDQGRWNEAAHSEFSHLQEIIRAFRAMRSSAGIGGMVAIEAAVLIRDKRSEELLVRGETIITRAANLSSLRVVDAAPADFATAVAAGLELYANLVAHIDIPAEIARAEQSLKKVEKELEKAQAKLNNPQFMQNAPVKVQEQQREALSEAEKQRATLLAVLSDLRSR